ncbi:MAG TPA: hypothetical protein VFB67_07240 [Candidatus Polarisedimenticolaceae bacterium]|nr:hypothetical protein [Candidatus Polarisedimenticolaceae bacterium]
MNVKTLGRMLAAGSLLWALPVAVRADEVVHFTNGAEMTVRTHTVEKEMVKLDLGGNSFISFPMVMVDKIVSAGKDVFLNPAFHPANQAVAGSSSGAAQMRSTGSIIADTAMRGGGDAVGLSRQNNTANTAGVMLGEAADLNSPNTNVGSGAAPLLQNRRASRFSTPQRRTFDPGRPVMPGAPAVVMPPVEQNGAPKGIHQISIRPEEVTTTPPPPPPQPGQENGDGTQQAPPEGDAPAQDPPENR